MYCQDGLEVTFWIITQLWLQFHILCGIGLLCLSFLLKQKLKLQFIKYFKITYILSVSLFGITFPLFIFRQNCRRCDFFPFFFLIFCVCQKNSTLRVTTESQVQTQIQKQSNNKTNRAVCEWLKKGESKHWGWSWNAMLLKYWFKVSRMNGNYMSQFAVFVNDQLHYYYNFTI